MKRYTAVLTCHDCGHELNRAVGVPENERTQVAISSPLVAGRCPNGCRSTFSDCNLNYDLTWTEEPDEGVAR